MHSLHLLPQDCQQNCIPTLTLQIAVHELEVQNMPPAGDATDLLVKCSCLKYYKGFDTINHPDVFASSFCTANRAKEIRFIFPLARRRDSQQTNKKKEKIGTVDVTKILLDFVLINAKRFNSYKICVMFF